jgi:hypothetical protein
MYKLKLVLCLSYKIKYLQNEARKQKYVKEITLQLSTIFQIRLKNNTVNFPVIKIGMIFIFKPNLIHYQAISDKKFFDCMQMMILF